MNKILFVDDDPKLGEIARSVLDVFGYDISLIDNKADIQTAAWNEYRLIIIDWMFPGGAMAVYDAAMLGGYSGKTIVLSARDIENSQRLRLDQKGIAYLAKPFSAISLSDAVEKAFK